MREMEIGPSLPLPLSPAAQAGTFKTWRKEREVPSLDLRHCTSFFVGRLYGPPAVASQFKNVHKRQPEAYAVAAQYPLWVDTMKEALAKTDTPELVLPFGQQKNRQLQIRVQGEA